MTLLNKNNNSYICLLTADHRNGFMLLARRDKGSFCFYFMYWLQASSLSYLVKHELNSLGYYKQIIYISLLFSIVNHNVTIVLKLFFTDLGYFLRLVV